jgi:hypothetical protein
MIFLDKKVRNVTATGRKKPLDCKKHQGSQSALVRSEMKLGDKIRNIVKVGFQIFQVCIPLHDFCHLLLARQPLKCFEERFKIIHYICLDLIGSWIKNILKRVRTKAERSIRLFLNGI